MTRLRQAFHLRQGYDVTRRRGKLVKEPALSEAKRSRTGDCWKTEANTQRPTLNVQRSTPNCGRVRERYAWAGG